MNVALVRLKETGQIGHIFYYQEGKKEYRARFQNCETSWYASRTVKASEIEILKTKVSESRLKTT